MFWSEDDKKVPKIDEKIREKSKAKELFLKLLILFSVVIFFFFCFKDKYNAKGSWKEFHTKELKNILFFFCFCYRGFYCLFVGADDASKYVATRFTISRESLKSAECRASTI